VVTRLSLILEVRARVLEAEVTLFRACAGLTDSARQLDSFRSHHELQRAPRGPEQRATAIHMAVSMFDRPELCWQLVERTRGRIGDHVAELYLRPGYGICVTKRGGPGHWATWGRPLELQRAIVDYRDR
jgi:hypothetical protein